MSEWLRNKNIPGPGILETLIKKLVLNIFKSKQTIKNNKSIKSNYFFKKISQIYISTKKISKTVFTSR